MRRLLRLPDRVAPGTRTGLLLFAVYLALPYVFFAVGINIFETALAPGDGGIFGVPTKVFTAFPRLWNPYIQGGTFPFKDIGWQSLYLPGILVMRVFPNLFGYNFLLFLHYTAAGFFTFLFLRRLGLTSTASFLGGLTFMFSGFLTGHKGHHSMVMASAYLPGLLYSLESFLVSGKAKWLAFSALAFGLSILADYTAVAMYIGMVTFPYLVFRILTGSEWKDRGLWQKLVAIAVYSSAIFLGGMMFAAVEILPILESLQYVTRQQITFDFFASYSFSWKLLPSLIFPYIYGSTTSSFYKIPYFGPWSLTEIGGYMGILPLLFVILCVAFFHRKNLQIYFWVAVFLAAFLLVLGDSTPLYRFLYRVPVYNLFRAPARNWLEVHFAAAVVAAFFTHYMMTEASLQPRRYFRTVHILIAVLSLLILVILFGGVYFVDPPEILSRWLQNTRLDSPAVYVPLLIITVSVTLLYLAFRNRESQSFWLLITITIFLDLFSFGYFHENFYVSYKFFRNQPNPVALFLEDTGLDKTSYRIFPLSMNDYEDQLYPSVNILYGFHTVHAYSPIWLQDYADLTGFAADGSVLKHQILSNSTVLSALSTRYVIAQDDRDRALVENIVVDDRRDSGNLIHDGFKDPSWAFTGLANRKNKSVTLALKEPAPVSMMQYAFAPDAGTVYKVTFRARMHKGQEPDDLLAIDLYAPEYDSPDQDAYILPSEMSTDFRRFTTYLYTGQNPPASISLRIFTYSKFPYDIKDVHLMRSGGYRYWGEDPAPVGNFPLYQKRYESPEGVAVYENRNFLPRARFATSIIPVDDASSAIHALRHDDTFDPSRAALVEDLDFDHTLDDGQLIGADFSRPGRVILDVITGENSFLVLADSWYPGWRAYVDGRETHIYKTNAVSRGILIQGEGEHLVEFRFVPLSFYLGLSIAGLATIAMSAWLLLHRTTLRSRASGEPVVQVPGSAAPRRINNE